MVLKAKIDFTWLPRDHRSGRSSAYTAHGRRGNRKSEHLKYPTQGHGAIPSFSSYEEEAEWWDAHDTGADEIQAELHPVKVRFAKNLSEAFKVRFDQETVRKLRERAQATGVGPTTLIRRMVLEQLKKDDERSAS